MANVKGSKKKKNGRFVEHRKEKLIGFKVEERFLGKFEKVLKNKGTDKSTFMRQQVESFMESYKECEKLGYMVLDEYDLLKNSLEASETKITELDVREKNNLHKEAERAKRIAEFLGEGHPLYEELVEYVELINRI